MVLKCIAALHFAATQGHEEVIDLLLDHGANIDVQNEKGWTAVTYASTRNQVGAMKLLMRRGARVDLCGPVSDFLGGEYRRDFIN